MSTTRYRQKGTNPAGFKLRSCIHAPSSRCRGRSPVPSSCIVTFHRMPTYGCDARSSSFGARLRHAGSGSGNFPPAHAHRSLDARYKEYPFPAAAPSPGLNGARSRGAAAVHGSRQPASIISPLVTEQPNFHGALEWTRRHDQVPRISLLAWPASSVRRRAVGRAQLTVPEGLRRHLVLAQRGGDRDRSP